MRKAALLNWITYRLTVRNRVRSEVPRWRVGIYKADRLGDFVLSLGVIRAIVDFAGKKNCVLFHSAVAAQLAAREFPDIARVQLPELDSRLWVTRGRLRSADLKRQVAGGVDQLLCLRHFRALFDEMALQLIPAREIWCVANSKVFSVDSEMVRKRFNGDVTVPRPAVGARMEGCEDLSCHESLLKAWARGVPAGYDLRPFLAQPGACRQRVLALAPFGSHRIRDLPLAGVAACAAYAKKYQGLEPVLFAPPGAVQQYELYARQLAQLGVETSVRVTATTDELIDALASSTAVLTTETATAHLATALDLPMVCIVGGGHNGLFSPWHRSERQIWLTHEMPCFGCAWICHHPEPYCITRVSPDQIVKALERVLSLSASLPAV